MSATEASSVCERLAAGPERGLGCAAAMAVEAAAKGKTLRALVKALNDNRPVVVARAANALKQIQSADVRALDAYARTLVFAALKCEVLQARWNLFIVIGGLRVKGRDRALAIDLMFGALGEASVLLRVFAMQVLVEMAEEDPNLRDRVRPLVARALEDRSAAVRARARKLSRRLGAALC